MTETLDYAHGGLTVTIRLEQVDAGWLHGVDLSGPLGLSIGAPVSARQVLPSRLAAIDRASRGIRGFLRTDITAGLAASLDAIGQPDLFGPF